ncbi:MAG: hypothetical protein H0X62_16460, partial [Bacteroidetes bacterium]|nr:hypothetical protein [Bacteroidota bacterium]
SQYLIPIIGTQYSKAQTTLDWQWLQLGGSATTQVNSNYEEIVDMEVDEEGNTYIIGRTYANSFFDNGNIFNWGFGAADIVVAKYNCSGQLLWIKFYGGNSDDRPGGIALDKFKNTYVCGTGLGSSSSVQIADSIFPHIGTSSLNRQSFVAKMDTLGNRIWLHAIRNVGVAIRGVDVDANENVFTVSFINGVGQYILGQSHPPGLILAKHDGITGTPLWAKTFTDSTFSGLANVNVVSVDDAGFVYVTGHFNDSLEISGIKLYPSGSSPQSNFIAKFDNDGNFLWVKVIPQAAVYSLKAGKETFYVGGTNNKNMIYGKDTLNYNSNPNGGAFIAKYDSSGTSLWGRKIESPNTTRYLGINLNKREDMLYTTGLLSVWGDFDSNTHVVSHDSKYDVFLAVYDTAGSLQYATNLPSTGTIYDQGNRVGVDGFGNAYVGGRINGKVYFGGDSLTTESNSVDMFIAKFGTSQCQSCFASNGDTLSTEICNGDSVLYRGKYFAHNGLYPDTLSNVFGCDTIKYLSLNVLPSYNDNLNLAICAGDSIMLFGQWRKTAGIFNEQFSSANGCDSIMTAALTINDLPQINITGEPYFCEGTTNILNAQGSPGVFTWQPSGASGSSISVNSPNTYSVQLSDPNNCISTTSFTTDFYPQLNPVIVQNGLVLSSATIAASLQWYKDNQPIPGATQQNYTITANGSYKVKTTSGDGCEEYSDFINITDVSIENHSLANNISIYPNPAKEGFYVKT